MPNHISRRAVLQALGATAFLAGCGDSATAHGNQRLTFTDQRGHRIALAGPARRVVTIPMPAASMLIAVDSGTRHLVGMHPESKKAIQDGILGEIYPQAATISSDVAAENFTPNVESIVALKPDAVVQWGDEGSGIIAPLENAGLDVAGLSYGTQADLERWITIFGAILGKPERARAMISRMHGGLHRARAEARARRTSPRIVYFDQYDGGEKVAGSGTYNDFCIRLIGATNPAGESSGMAATSPEQVLAWDPDIILLGNFDTAIPGDVYRDQLWAGVSAVRARRVYKVPLGGYRWDPPSQESPLMWRWLSMIAFGGSQGDLRDDIVEEYRFLYDYVPSRKQLDRILWTDVNSECTGYGRFRA
ncbi:MAG TPA: ABC transporter substrate-binding protein [Mycobacteriales bacterium]|nr:ABC transporter substrate-binding protein [Mycobacteriales bacterium]